MGPYLKLFPFNYSLIHTSNNVAKIFKPLGATLGESSSVVLSLDTRLLRLVQLLAKPRWVDPNKEKSKVVSNYKSKKHKFSRIFNMK